MLLNKTDKFKDFASISLNCTNNVMNITQLGKYKIQK